jgi:dihydropteroate synthase
MPARYPIRPLALRHLYEAHLRNLSIGVNERGAAIMAPKMMHISLLVEGLSRAAANVLKQQCLSCGCEAAVDSEVILGGEGCTVAIVSGDLRHFRILAAKLAGQPWGMEELGVQMLAYAERIAQPPIRQLVWRGKMIDLVQPLVVAVLNLTPDSFSDGGSYPTVESALEHVQRCEEEGAGALELGGESTRPNAAKVTIEEEMARVMPVLSRLRPLTKLPLIVDTRKVEVAHAALDAGADAVNDVTAMHDVAMREVVAKGGAGAILMHMQGEPGTMQQNPTYTDVVAEISKFLQDAAELCEQSGIIHNAIVLDPGIGFGKTLEHNMEILHRLPELSGGDYPMMVGLSRKAMIGKLTRRQNPQERLYGTLGGVLAAVAGGASLIRVHDVLPVVETLQVFSAIQSYKNSDSSTQNE